MEETACQTVLVVDDDAQARMLFKATLEAAGYRVLVAESGLESLALLQSQAAT